MLNRTATMQDELTHMDAPAITAHHGLLWRSGKVIPVPEADAVAARHGHSCAEAMVRALSKVDPDETYGEAYRPAADRPSADPFTAAPAKVATLTFTEEELKDLATLLEFAHSSLEVRSAAQSLYRRAGYLCGKVEEARTEIANR